MFGRLMISRRFAPLFWCQFLSAFNDNFVRQMLVMMILFRFGGADVGREGHPRHRHFHPALDAGLGAGGRAC